MEPLESARRPSRQPPRRPVRDEAPGPARRESPKPAGKGAARPERREGPRTGREAGTRPRTGQESGPRAGRGSTPPARSARPSPGHHAPPVPDDVSTDELPAEVRRELRSLPAGLADRVAGHLVMAGRLLDLDARGAYEHSAAARALAPRLAAVREAAGVTAYRFGRYAEALRDLRAVRRMTGSPVHLPLIADCERGLGRPERALALAADDPALARLDAAGQAEMQIVLAGARRDLGQLDAALMMLRAEAERRSDRVEEWTARVWYAYADALLAAGDAESAREWFLAVANIDDEGRTDAEDRLAELRPPGASHRD